MTAAEAPGWFGKLAMLGDFASRRLAPDWVKSCDQWLSAGMQSSRYQLGDAWLRAYLGAPVWRFAWAPGVVDRQWWFGVLMPSCDNVGRYFPLVVVQRRTQAPQDRVALDHLDLWWGRLARSALQTLGEGARLETFEADLHQMPPWPGADAAPTLRALPAAGRERHEVAAGASLSQLAQALAASSLRQRLDGCSLWWPLRDSDVAGHCSVQPGLPAAEAFAPMLLGQW